MSAERQEVDANQNETKTKVDYTAECAELAFEARAMRAGGEDEETILTHVAHGLRRLSKKLEFIGKSIVVSTREFLTQNGEHNYQAHVGDEIMTGRVGGFRYDPAFEDPDIAEQLCIQLVIERSDGVKALVPYSADHELVAM